jgi:hypothetical protein
MKTMMSLKKQTRSRVKTGKERSISMTRKGHRQKQSFP